MVSSENMQRITALISLVGLLAGGRFPAWGVPSSPLAEPTVPAKADRTAPTTKIEFERTPDPGPVRVHLGFEGLFQVADSIAGPWITLSNALSPLVESPTAPQRFYRTQFAPPASIFARTSVVSLTVAGPLQSHFQLAAAGSPDGIFPPVRKKPYFDGTLSLGSVTIPITLQVRGNSSLQECPFPKLKFKVSATNRTDTPFADAREVKIGTHCAEGGRGNIGRLRDERAAYREALAYEAMAALNFVSPRVRRAEIVYQDTSPTNSVPDGGWQVIRNAVLLDDVEVLAERLGGTVLTDAEVSALPAGALNEPLVTELQFLHALLGNWDYALGLDGAVYQNTDLIRLANRQLLPVAGDFDLASWVTGEVRPTYPRDYRPELPPLNRQVYYQLEQIQRRASNTAYQSASNRFVLGRAAIEARIQGAEIDEPGRTNALDHVTAFYEALSAIKP